METQTRHVSTPLILATCALCVACLYGCHGTTSQLARFDRTTGMTLLTADEPMVFARTEGRYSRSARDYIYLGPVETNRQGTREYYLWVGVATTLDRGYLAPEAEAPTSLLVDIQGELMALKLEPWSDRVPRLESVDLYGTAVDIQSQLAARVTLNQLAILSHESLESVRVADAGGRTRLYRRWIDGQSWHGFFQEALVSESVATDRSGTP